MTDTTIDALAAMRADIETVKAGVDELKAGMADLRERDIERKTDLRWIKFIGSGFVAILLFPGLREVIQSMF